MARPIALSVLLCEAGYDWHRADRLADIVDRLAPEGMSADDLFSALLRWRGKPRQHVLDAEEERRLLDSRRHRVHMFATTLLYWARDEFTPSALTDEAVNQLSELM